MIDVNKIRKDFPMLKEDIKQQGHHRCYFDNGATTLKPYQVIDACNQYYIEENANAHRGDYDIAFKVDKRVDEARETVAKFISADKNEIIFTSGTTMSLNLLALSIGNNFNSSDIVLISEAEHASNVLPWFNLSKNKGIKIEYVDLDSDGKIDLEDLKNKLNENVKVVSLAQVSNVLGSFNDFKEISKIVRKYSNALLICDAAQSVPHIKIDVKDMDVDFLCFSGHKMLGPTGIGVLYGKKELLETLEPVFVGGGDNARFSKDTNVKYLVAPAKFEAGTLNIAGIYGLKAAIDYINKIGIDNIHKYEVELKKYCVNKLKSLQNVIIYNENTESGIVTINVDGVPAQDEATYLNSKGICVRSGEHCAKLLKDKIGKFGSVRISLYFYNTKEEIDQLYDALNEKGDFLDAFFN